MLIVVISMTSLSMIFAVGDDDTGEIAEETTQEKVARGDDNTHPDKTIIEGAKTSEQHLDIKEWQKTGKKSRINSKVAKVKSASMPMSANLVNKKVSVTFDTTMNILASKDYTFLCGGVEREVQTGVNSQAGPLSFDVELAGVPEDGDVKLKELPEYMQNFYTILEQKYDKETGKLNIKLGRNIGVIGSVLKEGVDFNNLATSLGEGGFTMALYDNQGNELMQGEESSEGYEQVNFFYGLVPGEYVLKIKKAPSQYANYYIDDQYALTIAPNGSPKLSVYGVGGKILKNPYGGTDSYRFNNSLQSPIYSGVKIPFIILINKKKHVEKFINNSNIEGETKKTNVAEGDEVQFKLELTVPGDHNFALLYKPWLNIGAKIDAGIEDDLHKKLSFVENSLTIRDAGGKPVTDFTAQFDSVSNKIIVKDNTSIDEIPCDLTNKSKVPSERNLIIEFSVKVKDLKGSKKSIYNIVDGEKTELIPYKEMKVEKKWFGGKGLLDKVTPESFIKNFEIEVYEGNKKIDTVEDVSKYLKKGSLKTTSDKDFKFTLEKLPRYSKEELKKDEEDRTELTYKIVEKKNELSDKFSTIVNYDEKGDAVVNNVFSRKLADIEITKKWKTNNVDRIKNYTPLFELRSFIDGKEKDVWTFSKESKNLLKDGNPYTFTNYEMDGDKVTQETVTPKVSFDGRKYLIKGLPLVTEDGKHKITYEVREVDILISGESIKDKFIISGNDEKLKLDHERNLFSKEIVNEEKPGEPPETPPEEPKEPKKESGKPRTGDADNLGLYALLISSGILASLIKKRKNMN